MWKFPLYFLLSPITDNCGQWLEIFNLWYIILQFHQNNYVLNDTNFFFAKRILVTYNKEIVNLEFV